MNIIAITGGGQGIGRAIAYHFAEAGYAVSITDSDAEAGRETLAGIGTRKAMGLFLRGNIAKPGDVKAWITRTVKKLGVPDVLVNNAGIMIRKDVLKLTPAEFQKVMTTNLGEPFSVRKP